MYIYSDVYNCKLTCLLYCIWGTQDNSNTPTWEVGECSIDAFFFCIQALVVRDFAAPAATKKQSNDPQRVQVLAKLREWWQGLSCIETAMAHCSAIRPTWTFFYFPQNPWIRRQLIRLSEVDFKVVTPRVYNDLDLWRQTMWRPLHGTIHHSPKMLSTSPLKLKIE